MRRFVDRSRVDLKDAVPDRRLYQISANSERAHSNTDHQIDPIPRKHARFELPVQSRPSGSSRKFIGEMTSGAPPPVGAGAVIVKTPSIVRMTAGGS